MPAARVEHRPWHEDTNGIIRHLSLTAGTRLGPYEVVGSLGAGGMGEVYRARDTKLNREVALKILPDFFANDPDRLARFTREAQTLAALNHPGIAHIHGLEDSTGACALVMELVEGEDLSLRIDRGAIPFEDALPIARQIAEALEAAHEQGIIHRDLKPANIKVRSDGTVKVLDFGLAKVFSQDPRPETQDSRPAAATITSPAMTAAGLILGTAAYMSPEQARGKPVDRRADIWAFGVILYEMLTGRRAFGGEDISLTLAAVLRQELDFGALPPDTPPSVRRLLQRCLQKDPRKRLSAIADAKLELDEPVVDPPTVNAAIGAPGNRWRGPLVGAVAGTLVTVAVFAAVLALRQPPTTAAAVIRSTIASPGMPIEITGNRTFAINPAGTEIVFVGQPKDQPSRLFRRRLSGEDAVAIAGTDGALGPVFSPDGQWLVFTQQNHLKKIPAAGGGAVDLGFGGGQGATFLSDGSIVFNTVHGEGLYRVGASGGEPKAVTTVARDKGESGHHWPGALPDGKHVLFTTELDGKSYSEARIELLTLDTVERRVLIEGGSDARFVPTGHLLYWREGDLWRVPFDATRGQITGSSAVVLPNVILTQANGNAQYAVANNGTLVYMTGTDPHEERSLVLVDRAGVARALTTERRAFENPAISPDGHQLAVTVTASNDSLWTLAIGRPALTRITFEAENAIPVWSPDGTRVAFARHQGGEPPHLFVLPNDKSSAPELIRDPEGRVEFPSSWSPSGELAFVRYESTSKDIWVVTMNGERKARPFLATRFDENAPRFSPDGHWIAYVSNESGRFEVYVRPFPGPGPSRLVSSNGGSSPLWRADGREIFYRNGEAVVSVDVTPGTPVTLSVPRVLFQFQLPFVGTPRGDWATWDVMPDGKAFVLIQDLSEPRTTLSLVQNWFEELKQP